jgi:hypothetical protein
METITQAHSFEVSFGKFQNGFLEQFARLGKRLINRKFCGTYASLQTCRNIWLGNDEINALDVQAIFLEAT